MTESVSSERKWSEANLRRKGHLESLNVDWLTRTNSPVPQQHSDSSDSNVEKEQNHSVNASKQSEKLSRQNVLSERSTSASGVSRAASPRSSVPNLSATSNGDIRERRSSASDSRGTNEYSLYTLNPYDQGLAVRRTKSLSLNSSGHMDDSKREKPGFLRSLFGRKKKDDTKRDSSRRSSMSSDGNNSETGGRSFQSNTSQGNDAAAAKQNLESASSLGGNKETSLEPVMPPLGRSKTAPLEHENDDNYRLDEFLQRYRANSFVTDSLDHKLPPPKSAKSNATFSIDEDVESTAVSKSQRRVDAKGRPIPSHPRRSRLPPAIKKQPSFARSEHNRRLSTTAASPTNKFGAFLKRVTSHTDDPSSRASLSDSDTESSDEDPPRRHKVKQKVNIPGLDKVKPLRKVSFATNTYFNDPPQQICSKNPRRGEVEVNPDGSVIIHRLTPEEKREILQKTTSGIVVGGSGHLKLLSNPTINETDMKKREEKKPEVAPSEAKNGVEVANNTDRPAKSAQSRARKNSIEASKSLPNNEEEVSVSKTASEVKIDKPMMSRRSAASLNSTASVSDDEDSTVYPPQDAKVPLDIVYTRCCHLREILPIPATLKQLKKGSTDPIPLLQLRNPKPSLIEVLSFSDFLSVAPVLCLSLDGVSLSVEMLNVILCAIVQKKEFEKLSLRNAKLDPEGWKVLCYFVAQCKSLSSLDLTMVPGVSINVQKPSKSSQKSSVMRMESSLQNRKDMNWDLLTASLTTNGGLEEIILSGAKMSLQQFKNFIELGCISTERLGLAYNELTAEQCTLLAEWLAQSNVTGIDMGYNDLRGKLDMFSTTLIEKMQYNNNVFKYISLNSTNLEVSETSESTNNELLRLISSLCYCDNLKLLDLSNNPQIFPHITRHLTNYLPVFVNLMRLQLDYNNIPSTSVVTLAEVFPMCSKLSYVSMQGTKLDSASACALAAAMRKSTSLLTLDIDVDGVSEKVRDRISLFGLRNMESALKKVDNDANSDEMSANLKCLQKELSVLLTEKPMKKEDLKVVAENFVARLTKTRCFINKMTEDLFKLRVDGNLSTSGKETLIRFCFIDATFERGLRLLAQRYTDLSLPNHQETSVHLGDPRNIKRAGSSATLSSKQFTDSGHSALLPFHHPPIEYSGPAEDAVEIKEDESDTPASHAREQLKEEGSVLRKSQHIMDQTGSHQHHKQQHEATGLPNGVRRNLLLEDPNLRNAAANLDSEQIKEFILTNDIASVTQFLEDLRDQGVNLHELFKKRQEGEYDEETGNSQPHITRPLSNALQSSVQKKEKEQDMDDEDEHTAILDASNEEDASIDRVYDEVLDNIQKVRKYSQG
ncbi:LADA_0E08108g1_1 [Lachancea dasiensis]|uniref:LADA_0E08108g1_1 n=1 Tax=Lachancea dasiensis TaxID=1072105 RepID=A0A1G4JD39_9SACH|nr:LADA_0E08108g1_1 [Lachancea dasiensis]